MRLGEARVPIGLRLYAIGDVHGRDDLLGEVHAKITADLATYPCETYRIIHLGDYVDRGSDSAAVIERLSRLSAADEKILCLRGNHEELLLDFLADPVFNGAIWLINGGVSTLDSYGIDADRWRSNSRQMIDFGARFEAALPDHHRDLLNALDYTACFGDYFFCHAGVKPGVPFERQDPLDLTWIREDFLKSEDDFGAVVVHGHTPAPEPEVRSNRINIDTGAVLSGKLTCLVLEENTHRFL
jgi:serine/threonine protein phosphatase 1